MNRLAIVLFFRAPLGGLHENILSTASAAIRAGWDVFVFSPSGRFIDEHLLKEGIQTFAVDFQSSSSVEQARNLLCSADIIHAHPGPSRTLALEAALISGAPVVFTIHGAWFDGVQHYAHRLAAIVGVSSAVHTAITAQCPTHSRIECIPNGIDTSRFSKAIDEAPELGHIAVASRLDADKRVLIDTLISLWEVQSRQDDRNGLRYTVAGHGTLKNELELAAQRLGIQVDFHGWQTTDALAQLFGKASAVIASGRGAMEALASGRPTLALASAGAAEVFNPSQLPEAARSNFGGFGAKPVQSNEELFESLNAVSRKSDFAFAEYAKNFIREHHDSELINQRLLALYNQVLVVNRESGAVPPAPTF